MVVPAAEAGLQRGTLIKPSAESSLQPKEDPLETFFHKIVMIRNNLRVLEQKVNASESQVYRDQFLASIRDRLGTAAAKGQALDLCQELFLADGAQSYEEDDALQNLKELLA